MICHTPDVNGKPSLTLSIPNGNATQTLNRNSAQNPERNPLLQTNQTPTMQAKVGP